MSVETDKMLMELAREDGIAKENERIIKFLDERLCVCSYQPHCLNDDHLHPADVMNILKGENK